MEQKIDYSLATEVRSKNDAFETLMGRKNGDRIQALEDFQEHASKVRDLASSDSYSLIFNVKSLREQLTEIVQTLGRDNRVRDMIAPMAKEYNIGGF